MVDWDDVASNESVISVLPVTVAGGIEWAALLENTRGSVRGEGAAGCILLARAVLSVVDANPRGDRSLIAVGESGVGLVVSTVEVDKLLESLTTPFG